MTHESFPRCAARRDARVRADVRVRAGRLGQAGGRAVFTFVDADHHTEDWTFMMPDGSKATAHIKLARAR